MIKINRVGHSYQDKSTYASFLERIKLTSFGKFYSRYLKKIPIVRALAIYSWECALSQPLYLYAKFIFVPLKSMSKATESVITLYEKEVVLTPIPKIYPRNKVNLIGLQLSYEFPEISVSNLKDFTVIGASNFIHNQDFAVHHDLFRPTHDYTSEELHVRYSINPKKSLIARFLNIETTSKIENGALFTDAISSNYAHFLTEVLPRIHVYAQQNPHLAVTYIIDIGLHTNLMQALEIIVGNNADLIGLERGEPLIVESLDVISPCGYIPFQRRPSSKKLSDHSDGIFSPSALISMREKILNIVSQMVFVNKSFTNIPRRIFIRRNSAYRNILNSREIEAILLTKDFVIIEPEKLSFYEQVFLFSNAEIVVGATGAAMSNLIFSNENTKIIILIAEYENMIYGYWQNMACAVGNNITYVIGKNADIKAQLHSNFSVKTQDLIDAIFN